MYQWDNIPDQDDIDAASALWQAIEVIVVIAIGALGTLAFLVSRG